MTQSRKASFATARPSLGLEALDNRLMPAGFTVDIDITHPPVTTLDPALLVNTTQPGIRLVNGVLFVIGDAEGNDHSLYLSGKQVVAAKWTAGGVSGTSPDIHSGGLPLPTLSKPGDWEAFPLSSVTRIDYYGNGGNDKFRNETSI